MAREALMVGAGVVEGVEVGEAEADPDAPGAAGVSPLLCAEHAASVVLSPNTPINHQGHEGTRGMTRFFASSDSRG
jgi:hypothetical protein